MQGGQLTLAGIREAIESRGQGLAMTGRTVGPGDSAVSPTVSEARAMQSQVLLVMGVSTHRLEMRQGVEGTWQCGPKGCSQSFNLCIISRGLGFGAPGLTTCGWFTIISKHLRVSWVFVIF